jgi:glutamate synthase domain-containing protein 2
MRSVFYIISIVSSLLILAIYPIWPPILYFLIILVPYIIIGVHDIFSIKHTVLRNYPVTGHLRYMFESIRPEIHQYFVESDNDGMPYSREVRSLIYQRAKGARETIAFGTTHDITSVGYQFSYHSLSPKHVDDSGGRLIIGGPDCKKPYNSSILNISGMSFGALSPNAIRALNKGAYMGNFAHNTGEGGISPYHLEGNGDLIWQVGTGYFGCRFKNGSFDPEAFEAFAKKDIVKMIELKLSQGAKPAHGGILPGVKVTEEIAKIRLLEPGLDAISPPAHTEFSDPIGLLKFIEKLRRLSGGKPVGFKLCIGRRVEFMAICKAMIETGIKPDFITIDGAEGGTGAAPVAFANHLGTPINEAITFVNNCLVGANLRQDIKLIASGKIAIGYDMVTKIALGADGCNAARAMMFALGCLQSLKCNTDKCPTGIATQNKSRWSSLDVSDKSIRVANFHRRTVDSFLELIGALGVSVPDELDPSYIFRYTDVSVSKSYATLYPQLEPGELLNKKASGVYADMWKLAKAGVF